MKSRKDHKQEPNEESPLIKRVRCGRNPLGKDGIKWQPLQKEDRRILFDVFFRDEKTAYLDHLKKTIPILLNLHRSFWQNRHFLRWQLIRLNTEYQAAVEKIWRDRWTHARKIERQEIEELFFDFHDCIPRKIDTYRTWEFAGWSKDDKIGKRRFGVQIPELKAMWKVNFPPIPWVFRFIPRGYLNQLPRIPGYGYGKPRGRPIKLWAKNLLVYELSQSGMKNMEIARLVFGVKKSTEYWLKTPKHPILVKIAKVKEAMNEIISKSYPLLPRANATRKPASKSKCQERTHG